MTTRAPEMDTGTVPYVPWSDFVARWNWRQGEHVTAIGRTGSGKTTLVNELLAFRDWVVVFGMKPRDETLEKLVKSGYKRIYEWPPPPRCQRVVLWPVLRSSDDITNSAGEFHVALNAIFRTRGWTIDVDEVRYACERLGLKTDLVDLYTLGRAMAVTMVGGAQRPAWVPVEMLTQATHLFLFRINGKDDLDRIRYLGAADADTVRAVVQDLPEHAFLYVNTVSGTLLVSRVEV